MQKNNIQFWYHPIMGGTGLQTLLESLYPNSFKLYTDGSDVDSSVQNIITFFWETHSAINLEVKTNKPEFFELVSNLNNKGFYFLADYTTEANNVVDLDRIEFLSKLVECGVGLTRNFALTTNDSTHLNLVQHQYGNHTINKIHFPHFLISTPLEMSKYITDVSDRETTKPTKDFLCLNRRMQSHKFNMVKHIWENGELDNTHFSWVCNKMDIESIKDEPIISALGIDLNNFQSIQLEGDIMYGSELDTADEYLYTINPEWYYKSKVNIIIETNAYDSPTHITEKTLKSIFLETPFVVFGTDIHLDVLREIGFIVFDELTKYQPSDERSVLQSARELAKIYDCDYIRNVCRFNRKVLLDTDNQRRILETYFISSIKTLNNT
jgi:hypothetical protein